MAHVRPATREMSLTIAVVGAARAGKSTVLRSLAARVAGARPGGDSAADGWEAGGLLDWLRLDLGEIRGWRVDIHLYALSLVAGSESTRDLILGDADAVLFIADAQAARLADGVEALRDARSRLTPDARGTLPPIVFLHTKRDLPAELLLAPAALDEVLNPDGDPSFGCAALQGEGVREGLEAAVHRAMSRLVAVEGEGA